MMTTEQALNTIQAIKTTSGQILPITGVFTAYRDSNGILHETKDEFVKVQRYINRMEAAQPYTAYLEDEFHGDNSCLNRVFENWDIIEKEAKILDDERIYKNIS